MKNDSEYDALSRLPIEQRWRGQVFPAPIVVALIRRLVESGSNETGETHYLLIRRKDSPYDGKWALVGGKWDFGERLMDAIVREVKEETDLDSRFIGVRGIVSERVITRDTQRKGAHFLIFVCELEAGNGEAKEQDEGEVGWFTCQEIDALHVDEAIIPSDLAMIRGFAGANGLAPYIEGEMRAPIKEGSEDPILLERFELIEGQE